MPSYWFQPEKTSFELGGRTLTLETGRMAKQAAGAVVVTYGETVVLVTVTTGKPREGIDFFPLTVDFVEKTSAAGKIPGGFFKREGRLADREVLVSRFIDRSIRPLFPGGLPRRGADHRDGALGGRREPSRHPGLRRRVGRALTLSQLPFLGPISAVRLARNEGRLIVNPSREQLATSDLDIVVAGSRQALVMVEGSAKKIPERELLEALRTAHAALTPSLDAQEDLRRRAGKPKLEIAEPADRKALDAQVRERAETRLAAALRVTKKDERYTAIAEIEKEVLKSFVEPYRSERVALDTLAAVEGRREGLRGLTNDVKESLHDLRSELMRRRILDQGERIDGRKPTEIRPIACEVRPLPRPHGVALFTRGETQALVYTTLGGKSDEQTIDGLSERASKRFYLHYNFPPFSVGEARPLRGPGRREVGHGNLAERAIQSVLPSLEELPVHAPHRLRDARVERLVFDGDRVRRDALADGRRRADRGAGRGHRDGSDRGGRSRSPSSPTSSATRTTWATWTSRSPGHGPASPRCRWTSRCAASTGR